MIGFFDRLRRMAGRSGPGAGRDTGRSGPGAGTDDQRFGTGLWRHNRDRFLRAVDRYYTTALALHEARTAGDTTEHDPIDVIIAGTHRLNSLVPIVDDITAQLHRTQPVTGQIVPGPARQALGDAPELLTKASSKVAEAVLAASMARGEAPAGRSIGSSARATERFISDAEELLERAQQNLARLEQP